MRIPKKLNPPINHQVVQQSPHSRGHESHNGIATLLDAAMLAASTQEQDPGQQKMYLMNPIQPVSQHDHVTSLVTSHVTSYTQEPHTRVPKQHVVQQGNMVAQATVSQNRAPQNVVHYESRVSQQPRDSESGVPHNVTHVIPPATQQGAVYQVKADHTAHHPIGDHQYSGHHHQMGVQNTSQVVHQNTSHLVTHQNTTSHQAAHQNTTIHQIAHQNISHQVMNQNTTGHQVVHQNTFHQTGIQPGSHHQNRVPPAQLQPQSIIPPHTQSGIPQHQQAHLNRPPPASHQNKGHTSGAHQTFEPYIPSVMQTPPKTTPHVVDGGATSSRGTNRGKGRGRGRGQSSRGTRGRGRGLRGNATGLNMSQQPTK